jgi:hypothetical protein
MFKLYKKYNWWPFIITITSILIALSLIAFYFFSPLKVQEPNLGVSAPDAQWIVIDKFCGFQTKMDASKAPDCANVNGQNTINGGFNDRISIRDFGFQIFPATSTASSTTNRITSLHTFKRRDGQNILIRTYDDEIEYFEEGVDLWERIATSSQSGLEYGFAEFNINTDLTSQLYFGNSVDPFRNWTGGHTYTTGTVSAGATSIPVFNTSGFSASGTVILCGTPVAYTSLTSNGFTVSSAPACGVNRGVAQYRIEYPGANYPRGNIYLAANNRLFISGITSTTEAVYFSRYADPLDFLSASNVTDSTDISPGVFNLGEGGGPVTALALDENSIYIFKKNLIFRATLSDTLYTLTPLKPFDSKAQAVGANNRNSIFSSSNGIFFVSSDKQIMHLARAANIDFPQINPISDVISKTVSDLTFASSTGIVWKDRAFITARNDTPNNDTVLIYNLSTGSWESPATIQASTFAIYDDGSDVDLFFGQSNAPNVYKIITDEIIDDTFGITASWRSKQFNFGNPFLKEIDDIFIEGYISPSTDLTISLLLDENGYTSRQSTTLEGTETNYIFDSQTFNLFGLKNFGSERFGANPDLSGKKKFRVYLGKELRRTPFHTAQIEFASDQENAQWEVTSFSFKVRPHSQPHSIKLYKAFK